MATPEGKLKALKVPELRSILSKAGLTTSGVKNDLIKRIVENPAALALSGAQVGDAIVEHTGNPGPEEHLASDQRVAPDAATSTPPKGPPSGAVVSPPAIGNTLAPATLQPSSLNNTSLGPTISASTSATTIPSEPSAGADSAAEIARRKARAERFGIPVVEKTPNATKEAPIKAKPASQAPILDNPDKLEARAARFGATSNNSGLSKPPFDAKVSLESASLLDPEEEEKRRKRAARFGTDTVTNHPFTFNTPRTPDAHPQI